MWFPQPNGYEFRRCFTEDRGEGVEKSGGFHQEFVKEVSFRKEITHREIYTEALNATFSNLLCLALRYFP